MEMFNWATFQKRPENYLNTQEEDKWNAFGVVASEVRTRTEELMAGRWISIRKSTLHLDAQPPWLRSHKSKMLCPRNTVTLLHSIMTISFFVFFFFKVSLAKLYFLVLENKTKLYKDQLSLLNSSIVSIQSHSKCKRFLLPSCYLKKRKKERKKCDWNQFGRKDVKVVKKILKIKGKNNAFTLKRI